MKKILFIGLAMLSIVSCKKETFNSTSSTGDGVNPKKPLIENEKTTNVVWGIGSDHRVYRWNAATVTWEEPNPGAGLSYISVGQDYNAAVWGITGDLHVFRRVTSGNYWMEPNVNVRLNQISAVSNSEAWAYGNVGQEGRIYKTTDGGVTWTQISSTGLPNYNGYTGLAQIKAMPDNKVVGLGRDLKIYSFNASTNQWSLLPNYSTGLNTAGTYRMLTGILGDESIWAIKVGANEANQHIYRYVFANPFGNYWGEPNYAAQLASITASQNGNIWGVSSSNHIYKWNGSSWDEPSPTARLIQVASGH